MGSQNRAMVNNIHLNRRGFKGEATAYFSEPKIPQEQHRTISAVSTRVQSDYSHTVSSEPELPAVKETVCIEKNMLQFLALKSVIDFCDNVCANLDFQNSCRHSSPVSECTLTPPLYRVLAALRNKNIFQNFGGRHDLLRRR